MATTIIGGSVAEEEIIKQRLQNDERALKRCIKGVLDVVASGAKGAAAVQTATAMALGELQAYRLLQTKERMVYAMGQRDIEQSVQTVQDIQDECENVKNEIVELRSHLDKQLEIRKHRLQYDETARVVNQAPSRSETQQALKQTQEELDLLQEDRASLAERVALRGKQVQAFYASLVALQDDLSNEAYLQKIDGVLAAAAAAVAATGVGADKRSSSAGETPDSNVMGSPVSTATAPQDDAMDV